jgi:hypothetical protein
MRWVQASVAMGFAAFAALALPAASAAEPPRPGLSRILQRAAELLAEASSQRVPPLRPPVPREVRWKAVRVASVDLGEPLRALLGADLSGDGKSELYAATATQLVALGWSDRKLRELSRLALPGAPPPIEPRDPVVTLTRDPAAAAVLVRSSRRDLPARAAWRGPQLVMESASGGFPMCPDRNPDLVSGRNYFLEGDGRPFWALVCDDTLVDASGRARSLWARLDTSGALTVHCVDCQPAWEAWSIADVGTAMVLADVNRDGQVEVIASSAGAPGDPDVVKVLRQPPTETPVEFRRAFSGSIVGIAAGDWDGDGAVEIVVAVQLRGSAKWDLWRLNR